MKKITVIALFILSLPNVIIGCTCYMLESFDIQNYDESTNVAEIKVIEKIQDDYEERIAQYKRDTLDWNEEYPPIPFLPNNFTEFNAEVIEIFKGKLKKGKIRLIASEKNSSCYWEPEVGKSYIFYFGKTTDKKDEESIEIGGCQRRIRRDFKNYDSEVEALRIFKQKKEGKFAIDQNDLIKSFNKPYLTIKGKFKKGQRHGKWIIAEPINHSRSERELRKKVLALNYKNGKLISVKYSKPYNNHVENYFTRNWNYYYDKRKL